MSWRSTLGDGSKVDPSVEAGSNISIVRDLSYGPEAVQRLDIYAPPTGEDASVLLDFHGGAWRVGSKAGRGYPAWTLVPKGVVWIAVDYGLAPDYTIDAIVDHACQAVAWAYRNVADHGGSPDRIFVSGNSAGGHLAAMLLMEGWHADHNVPEDVVKGAIAMSGIYDLEVLVGAPYGGPNDQLGMDVTTARRNSPIHNLPGRAPPLILAVGEPEQADFKRQYAEFERAWWAAGLPLSPIEVPNAHHFAMARQIADTESELHRAVMKMMGLPS